MEYDNGWAQVMIAGSSLYHEEYNVGEADLMFLQIWIFSELLLIETPVNQK